MYKLMLRDTEDNLKTFIDFFKLLEKKDYLILYSISSLYKDRNSLYYRVYIELSLQFFEF